MNLPGLSVFSTFVLAAAAVEDQGLHLMVPNGFEGVTVHEAVMVTADTPFLEHYGHPPEGCASDEKAFQISGVPGMICAPLCSAGGGCPTDVPSGVSAVPQCALENQATGEKYCVLICPGTAGETEDANLRGGLAAADDMVGDGACGDATCQIVQAGLGICTYES